MTDRALVIGDDCNAFLAVVRSLGRHGVRVDAAVDGMGEPALASLYIDRAHLMPSYAKDPAAWHVALDRIVAERDIMAVFPTSDSSLVKLASHRSRSNMVLAVPSRAALEAFTDKGMTRRLAVEQSVPVPPGVELGATEDADALIDRLGLPIVLKPRRSYRLGEHREKAAVSILSTRDEVERALATLQPGSFLAEGFFAGIGVGLSVVARDGQVVHAYQHRRLEAASPTGASTRRISEKVDEDLHRDVSALVERTRLTGVAMFEFRSDRRTGRHVLLEVNPRFWGSLPLAIAAGADFPAILFDLLMGRDIGLGLPYRIGLIGRDMGGEYDRIAGLLEGGRFIAAFAQGLVFLLRLLMPAAWDSHSADDPAPFRCERRLLLRRLRSKLGSFLPRMALRRRTWRRPA